ncbi:MAG: hypothetical protein RRY78_05810 [Clostridia bacterium]
MASISDTKIIINGYISKASLLIGKNNISEAKPLLMSALNLTYELAKKTCGLEQRNFVNLGTKLNEMIKNLEKKEAQNINGTFANIVPNYKDFNKNTNITTTDDSILQDNLTLKNGNANINVKDVCDIDSAKACDIKSLENESNDEPNTAKIVEVPKKEIYNTIATNKNSDEEIKKPSAIKEEVEIELAQTQIFIYPNEPIEIEFFLNKRYNDIFVEIAGVKYTCENHIKNWVCKSITNVVAGEYEVTVSDVRGKIASFKIILDMGFANNDLGI